MVNFAFLCVLLFFCVFRRSHLLFSRNRRLPYRTHAHKLVSDSWTDAADFPLDSLARPPRADGFRPRVQLWLKRSAARPANSRPRADRIRRAAERFRCAAERSYHTERLRSRALCADCDWSYLLTGVFSAPAFGVFVRRRAASAGGLSASPYAHPRLLGQRVPELRCTLTSLFTTSRPPLTSSTLSVTMCDHTTSCETIYTCVRHHVQSSKKPGHVTGGS